MSGETVRLSQLSSSTLPVFAALVREEYSRRGWMDPSESVADKFDIGAHFIVVEDGEEIIAGMRIVKDVGLGFPHEELMGLDSLHTRKPGAGKEACDRLQFVNRAQMAEITKLVGRRRTRNLTIDLAKCIYWFAKAHNIAAYLMVIDMEFFILCDRRGVPIHPIGTPQICEGSWTIPAVIFPEDFPTAIQKKSPEHWDYISRPTDMGDYVRH